MATPTQPLGLSAAAIAVLQARQSPPQSAPEPGKTPAPSQRQAPAPPSAGRGRFIDLLA